MIRPCWFSDEATAGLDVLVARALLNTVAELRRSRQVHRLLHPHHRAGGRKTLRPHRHPAPRQYPRRGDAGGNLRSTRPETTSKELFFQLISQQDQGDCPDLRTDENGTVPLHARNDLTARHYELFQPSNGFSWKEVRDPVARQAHAVYDRGCCDSILYPLLGMSLAPGRAVRCRSRRRGFWSSGPTI